VSSSRNGEHGNHPPFRSKRLYRVNGHWYFDTREGTQFGPFSDHGEAKKALAIFVAQNVYKRAEDGWHGDESPGEQDGIAHMVNEVIDILRCHIDFGPLAANTWVKSRLEDLELNSEKNSITLERIGVLRYAMEYGEKLFDSGVFLEELA